MAKKDGTSVIECTFRTGVFAMIFISLWIENEHKRDFFIRRNFFPWALSLSLSFFCYVVLHPQSCPFDVTTLHLRHRNWFGQEKCEVLKMWKCLSVCLVHFQFMFSKFSQNGCVCRNSWTMEIDVFIRRIIL